MLKFILNDVLPLVGIFAVGVFGWFVTKFVANPYFEFRKLRAATHEVLFFTANAGNREVDPDAHDGAVAELRRTAAQLSALSISIGPIVRWWISRRHNLKDAVDALTGFSNSLQDRKGGKAAFRYDVEIASNLDRSYDKRPKIRD